MTPKNEFGRYFRSQRVTAGISLRKVADALAVSHVYLGEIERGVRAPLPEKYWEKALKIVPTLSRTELERTRATTRPLQLDLQSKPRAYQDLGLLLARRIQNQDLGKVDLDELLRMLRGYDEDD